MSDEQRPSLTFIAAAMWTIGAVLFLDLIIRATEAARPGAVADLINVTACQLLTYSALVFVMLRIYAPVTRVREAVAFRAPSVLGALGAIVLGVGIYPAVDLLDSIVARRYPASSEELELLGRLLAAPTPGRRVLLAAAFLVLIPAASEVFFRGVLFGGLRKTGRASLVVLGTAVYFTAARAPDERALVSFFALGVLTGWLRERTDSILPSFLAHAAFFALPVLPLVMGADPSADFVVPRPWMWTGLVAAALVAALFEWRAHVGRRAAG